MLIYSASRRTDLVAFYPGYICEKVKRSRKLGGIVFWTKNPSNLILHSGLNNIIRLYPSIIQLTITGLGGTWWEPDVPHPESFAKSLTELAALLPKGAIRWRFDPIIWDDTCLERLRLVRGLLDKCGVNPDSVIVSFPDAYAHAVKRLAAAGGRFVRLSYDQKLSILEKMYNEIDLPLELCCENELLTQPYLRQAHCIDGKLFDRLYGTGFADLPPDASQRAQCGCCKSTDIGSYEQLCGHNCRYCYARPETDAEQGIEKK